MPRTRLICLALRPRPAILRSRRSELVRFRPMNKSISYQEQSWKQSRYGFAGFGFLSLLVLWFVLRLVLFVAFRPAGLPLTPVLWAFASGFQRDFFVALVEMVPLLFWLLILPDRRSGAAWHRVFFLGGCFVFWFVQFFLLFVEYFFFDEFKSRFNTVAVDYLLFPREVFVNIWESYHVGVVLLACAALSFGWMFAASKLFGAMWERPFSARTRMAHLAAVSVLALALAPTINLKGARVSDDRTLNEVADNGAIAFVAAACWSRARRCWCLSARRPHMSISPAMKRKRRPA